MNDSDKKSTEGNTRTTRWLNRTPCLSSVPVSALAIFCIGLLSGFSGGLLLGRTAAVVLRSLEFLSDNKLLMQQLNNYTVDDYSISRRMSHRTYIDPMFNIHISVLSEVFGLFTANISFGVGIFVGLSIYNLVIRKCGETATGKALGLAGPGCLMGVTATGFLFGGAFQGFLTLTSSVDIGLWFFISALSTIVFLFMFYFITLCNGTTVVSIVCFLTPLNTPIVVSVVVMLSFMVKSKLVLGVALIPTTVFKTVTKDRYNIPFTTNHLPLMLIITEVFSLVKLSIVTIQSQSKKGNVVLEDVFIGILTSQFLMVAVGMSLFGINHRGGVAKLCVGAVTSGAAVVAVMESVLPVLGPGPTIGGLTGVAGAVGVTLAAAGATADYYGQVIGRCGLLGRFGVTVGAAVGAFLISCGNGGISAIFMALCAACIPAGLYLPPMFSFCLRKERNWKLKFCLSIAISILFLSWYLLTCTEFGAINFPLSLMIILILIIVYN